MGTLTAARAARMEHPANVPHVGSREVGEGALEGKADGSIAGRDLGTTKTTWADWSMPEFVSSAMEWASAAAWSDRFWCGEGPSGVAQCHREVVVG